MITIDGSRGEGGGQILRTSLALSMVTGKPFRVFRIRAGRKKPGLLAQHLCAVEAARAVSGAEVEGAKLGSGELVFTPGELRGGEYVFRTGTAGSATLVFQTVLPALLRAGSASQVSFEGGTHNPMAPPFEFLASAFLPLLARMGAKVDLALERPGFFPGGGGRFTARITPGALAPLALPARGDVESVHAKIWVAGLPRHVASRERKALGERMGLTRIEIETLEDPRGPGNAVHLFCESEHVTEVFTAFGEQGLRAEKVAEFAMIEAERYLAANVPVGEHLADQLMLLLALAGGGSLRTLPLSGHARTQQETIAAFLEVPIRVETLEDGSERVDVG